MKKNIGIGIIIVVAAAALFIGNFVWSLRNPAKIEADTVLVDFADPVNSFLWCENGYGKGIDNATPWWEQIYLGSDNFNNTASTIDTYLATRGYSVTSTFVEKGNDRYNKGKTYWEISGSKDKFSVKARVSSKEITLNNCFGGQLPQRGVDVAPESYDTVIVIQFREQS